MPPREAKARLLTREYVADRDFMRAFTAAEREWYLLTALFADDGGYLEWNLEDNAAAIYRYESPRTRETRVARFVEHFAETGRFVDLGCGHAEMPRVAKRPRSGGREYAVQVAHRGHEKPKRSRPSVNRSRLPVDSRVDQGSGSVLSSPVLSSPDPSSARARATEGPRAAKMTPLAAALEGTPFGQAVGRRRRAG